MGFFQKLFGDSKEGKEALSFLEKLVKEKEKQDAEAKKKKEEEKPQTQAPAPKPEPIEDDEDLGPSGFSWGPKMPAEENQFNYNGSFWEYFEMIFREDFAQYRVEKETPQGLKRIVYTFYEGERKALVIEVLSSACEAKAIRRKCGAAGIPYLRFYYDYDGWWNTRAYVDKRIGDALNGSLEDNAPLWR
ncbi:MAG: hypothetical protein J5950_07930 [Clostridia bacterium]|nr:hypothetical protein [Clostridia bacterium]